MDEDTQDTVVEPTELDTLKARADMMGLKYHHAIGVDKLRIKIDLATGATEQTNAVNSLVSGKNSYITDKEFKAEETRRRIKDAGKLVRARITCMNPAKQNWEGEIISVGSSKLGTHKKYIPFNAEEGWHIPKIIYDFLKERKCTTFYTVQGRNGEKIRKAKLVNEFSIETMAPLTKTELKELAQRQAMANGSEAA